ncbi:MAG: hypothetical protein IJM09_03635 [Neisseriaceae bacterium]|nr:hypothetical protein [Neisseriaceae bacterium]
MIFYFRQPETAVSVGDLSLTDTPLRANAVGVAISCSKPLSGCLFCQ